MGRDVSFNETNAPDARAYVAEPTPAPHDAKVGAIVLFHEWWGLNDHTRDLANRLAKEGFLVVALDMYRGASTTDPGEAMKLMGKLDTFEVMDRARDAATFARSHERSNGKVGVTGFCLGGAMSFAAACHLEGLAGVVPFYGIPSPEKVDYAKVTAPIQAHFAKHDEWATVTKAEAITKSVVAQGGQAELFVYDAQHAFMNDTRPEIYHAENAKLAWARMVEFFRRHLA